MKIYFFPLYWELLVNVGEYLQQLEKLWCPIKPIVFEFEFKIMCEFRMNVKYLYFIIFYVNNGNIGKCSIRKG